MKKNETNLIIINCVFICCLITANVIASKVVQIGPLTVPAAVVAYPITFLCTDIIGQIWGRREGNKTVRIGICVQVMSLSLILLAILLPTASFQTDYQNMFSSVLGTSWRFVIASLVAYCFSQSWDVFIFHKIKEKVNDDRKRWIWNNVSTMTSQIIDTAIFISIGFIGVVPNLLHMIVCQYVVKFILALLDTPIFMLLTKKENPHPVTDLKKEE